ncbi:hypothetical protein M3N55_03840 [Roseibaca sp. V10]|uniref:O-antigen ligase like membrane protein n=1 Tax=Roseinatronobacter domitianus TaxID=2940293 RepID=A0ABT0LZ15_9RHOB|nr:hypothetical protein [Roseibaca domitiana]MCL1627851.1 hypothetical protein [Roseibaca domitiana]
MGNAVAYLALLTWPLVILIMFKRMPVERAFIWSILGGYMALPQITQIGLPLLPDLDKVLIPNVTAFVVCLALVRERVVVVPQNLLARVLLVLFVLSPAFTVFTNTEPLRFGLVTSDHTTWMGIFSPANATIPGLRLYDSLSVVVAQIIFMLPFFLARSLLAHERALAELPRALVVAGLIYSVPIVIENAIGPELHRMVYGFIQHDYGQAIRFGGFRPYVFMPHGLWVAFFAMMCFASALLQARQAGPEERTRAIMIAIWLGLMLVLCRSVGPWALALVVAPLVLFFGPRMQLRIAALMALTAMAYPLLRGSGIVPADALVRFIAGLSPDRAESLAYRFTNEDILLERAADKPLFGWGAWGRNLVYDPETGEALTISDGQWIITIGQAGWLGYIATFGLLCLPLLALWWRYRQVPNTQIPAQVGLLALLLGANVVDLLPNATLIPFTWLLAGALLGHAELQAERTRTARIDKLRQSSTRRTLLATAQPRQRPDRFNPEQDQLS